MNHYVELDECKAWAAQRGFAWWLAYRRRFETSGKLTVVKSGWLDVVRISAADAEEAEFMRGHMVSSGGLPRTAVKVGRVRGGDA